MYYSIIIPIHNELNHLPLLLKSLKSLSIKHEIIIVDDGSNDGSDKILYQCEFIKYLKLDKNSGKGFALSQSKKLYEKLGKLK